MEFEYSVEENFQLFKASGMLLSLVLIVSVQLLFPNRLALRDLLSNWRVNVPLALINSGLMSLLCGACVCAWAVMVREHQIGFFALQEFPNWFEIGSTVVLLDFVAWIWHRANHRWPLLWRFHAVHHSDRHFDASTAFRFHPGELFISLGVRLLVVTLTALPLEGLIAFEVIFGFFNLFVHSDARIAAHLERLLGGIFVTPSLHRLHHSNRVSELDRNFGTIFSCWDRLAHTYRYAGPDTVVTPGLPAQTHGLGLKTTIGLPFKRSIPTATESVKAAE